MAFPAVSFFGFPLFFDSSLIEKKKKMSKKKIEVTIDLDGNIFSEFFGFEGASCYSEAAQIAKDLETVGVVLDTPEIIKNKSDRGQVQIRKSCGKVRS